MRIGQHVGFLVPRGGAGAITNALVRRLEARGGTVRCGLGVDDIVVRAGRAVAVQTATGDDIAATHAVLADVDAPTLYATWPDSSTCRTGSGRRSTGSSGTTTVKVDWNLDGPIPWRAEPARRAGTVHVTPGVDHLTRNAAELACRLTPSRPFLIVSQQSMTDPSRQSRGKETAMCHSILSATGEVSWTARHR